MIATIKSWLANRRTARTEDRYQRGFAWATERMAAGVSADDVEREHDGLVWHWDEFDEGAASAIEQSRYERATLLAMPAKAPTPMSRDDWRVAFAAEIARLRPHLMTNGSPGLIAQQLALANYNAALSPEVAAQRYHARKG